jgi:hypothetical protein
MRYLQRAKHRHHKCVLLLVSQSLQNTLKSSGISHRGPSRDRNWQFVLRIQSKRSKTSSSIATVDARGTSNIVVSAERSVAFYTRSPPKRHDLSD